MDPSTPDLPVHHHSRSLPKLMFIELVMPSNHLIAAAAKLLQSCPTLRDPMDCSLPGSSMHGIFQARVLEWGAIAFSKM